MKFGFEKTYVVFMWSAIVFVYIWMFALILAYDAFYPPPSFDELNIKSGVLNKKIKGHHTSL
ncbi:MAG: hypothetical protein ABFD75_16160 [Smithella sp.]